MILTEIVVQDFLIGIEITASMKLKSHIGFQSPKHQRSDENDLS